MKKGLLLIAGLVGISTSAFSQAKSQTLRLTSVTGATMISSTGAWSSFRNKYSDSVEKYSEISNYYQSYGDESNKKWAWKMLHLYDLKSDSLNLAIHKAEAKKAIESRYHIKLN